jgi:Fic family protein
MASYLMRIEAAKTTLENYPLPIHVERQLRQEARVRVAHNSTWIENRTLSLEDARAVIEDRAGEDPTRDKETAATELRNYWAALEFADRSGERPLTEDLIKELHAIILRGISGVGRPPLQSEYRQENVQVGNMEYLPPEWQDVPALMRAFVAWLKHAERESEIPGPVLAGIAAYQFVTIHPFTDGNGRTTRALATLMLARTGYGLNGLARMEEFYTRDVERYYEFLQMGLHHNYYFANENGSRSDPDLAPWLSYFLEMLAAAADQVRQEVEETARERFPDTSLNPLAEVPQRFRRLLSLLPDLAGTFTPTEVATWFGVTNKTAREWLAEWGQQGYVEAEDPAAQRVRRYRISPQFLADLREAGVVQ